MRNKKFELGLRVFGSTLLMLLTISFLIYVIRGSYDISDIFWFQFIFTIVSYFSYIDSADDLGIDSTNERFLKQQFECTITSLLSPEVIKDKIINFSHNTLGIVYLEDEQIRNKRFPYIRPKSEIKLTSVDDATYTYSLITYPKHPTLVDYLHNYRAFKQLTNLLSK